MEIQLTPKGQTYRGISRAVKVIVSVVVIAGLIVLARIVLLFFSRLKTLPGYDFIINLSDILMPPFKGIGQVKTPYDGFFDIGATVLLMVLIFVEFILSGIAGFFSRRAVSEIATEPAPQASNVQVIVSPNATTVAAGEPGPTADAETAVGEKAPSDEEVTAKK